MQRIPAVFEKIKKEVLGARYDLSVAFLSPAEMKKVDKQHPHPTQSKGGKPSNVLSFPLSPTSGEILICRDTAHQQAPLYHMSKRTFVAYLFIHGLLHLHGLDHGVTMDGEERRIMKRFGLAIHE